MAVQQDLALEVQQLQRGKRHAGKPAIGRLDARSVGPTLGPVRTHHDDATGRNSSMGTLPRVHVGDGQMVVRIRNDFVGDRYHRELAQSERRRQFVDGWKALVPVRGRVELRAELVGRERIRGSLQAGLLVGECGVRRLFVEPSGALLESGRRRKAIPDRRIRGQDVRQRNIACARERLIPHAPQPPGDCGGSGARGGRQRSGTDHRETRELQQTTSIQWSLQ